jgi:hypothetical protein
MAEMWTGERRIAFVPVSNEQVDQTLPPNFRDQVYQRVYADPDPVTGEDRSLQSYVHHMSSGRAYITGDVFPPVVAPDADVISVGLNSLPSIEFPWPVGRLPVHGYDYAVLVLPHSFGPHRNGYAWWDNPKINGVAHRARVALYTTPTFQSRQGVGVWAMESLHMLTKLGDLYFVTPQMGRYDVMACACGTHPSANTKSLFGWLRSGAIQEHPLGQTQSYSLHAVSLPQPAPPGRRTAIRVKSQTTAGYFMIECRLRTDPYERQGSISSGIPAEGILVYEVQSDTMVFLRSAGLAVGQSFQIEGETLEIKVTESIPGGFVITVTSFAAARCRELQEKIKALQASLEVEDDLVRRKALISALAGALKEHRELNCDRIPGIWDESVHGRLLGDRILKHGIAPPPPDDRTDDNADDEEHTNCSCCS